MIFQGLLEPLHSLRHVLFRLFKPLMTDHAIELYDLQQALEHSEKGRLDEAMDILQRAIASNTSNPLFYEIRGLVYELQSKYDKAIADFNHVIALGVMNPIHILTEEESGANLENTKGPSAISTPP